MIKPRSLVLLLAILCSLLLAGAVLAQASTTYDLSWHVAGNGGQEMASTTYVLQGTIGQPLACQTGSDRYALTGGYWYSALARWSGGYTVYLPLVLRTGP